MSSFLNVLIDLYQTNPYHNRGCGNKGEKHKVVVKSSLYSSKDIEIFMNGDKNEVLTQVEFLKFVFVENDIYHITIKKLFKQVNYLYK